MLWKLFLPSGARKFGVPHKVCLVSLFPNVIARPKSASLATPFFNKIFPVLISRWRIFLLWMYFTALTTWIPISATLSSGIRLNINYNFCVDVYSHRSLRSGIGIRDKVPGIQRSRSRTGTQIPGCVPGCVPDSWILEKLNFWVKPYFRLFTIRPLLFSGFDEQNLQKTFFQIWL